MDVNEPLLFAEPTRERNGALGWVEPQVHWFTESTRELAIESRANVNQLYSEFPDSDGALGARLRSEIDSNHLQALDELLVSHLLRGRWEDVRYEEGGKGPDFRAYGPDGVYAAGVEVASLFEREDWSAEQLRHGRLADLVNRDLLPTAGYFVDFRIEKADRDPSPRKFVRFLEGRLNELPDPGELQLPPRAGRSDLPSATYVEDGVHIGVSFMPMSPGAPARTDPDARIVGTGAMVGGEVNTVERLRDRVSAKAGGRYAIDEAPFLVAVGLHQVFESDHEIVTALYGTEAVDLRSEKLIRRNDGIFGWDSRRPEGRNRRVSGVAILRRLHPPWDPDQIDVAVLTNPLAARPWPSDHLRATRRFGEVGDDDRSTQLGWIEETSPLQ